MKSHVKKTMAMALCAVVFAWSAAGPAEAARIVGRWDPAYGALFPNLGWSGESEFFVPNECIVANGTVTQASCPLMTAGFVQLKLYTLTGPALSEMLEFEQEVDVFSMVFADGQLTGVNSDFFEPEQAMLAAAGLGNFSFTLRFSTEGARLFHLTNVGDGHKKKRGKGHVEHGEGFGYGHTKQPCSDPPDLTINTADCGFSETFGLMRFSALPSQIPEPQTLALLLAGFAALGFATRRRSQH